MPATSSSSPSSCPKGHRTANRRSRWASLAKQALVAAVAVGGLSAGQARALVVNVPGYGKWDVTTFTGSYNDNASKFATAANGGVMPWWLDEAQANAFATAVGSALGSPNGFQGPYFGFAPDRISDFYISMFYNNNIDATIQQGFRAIDRSLDKWAQATQVPEAAVPGPLPALGAAAAFGFSRKLRQRIKASSRNAADVG